MWQILAKEKVDVLPVSVTRLGKQMGITVKLYDPTDGNSGTAQIVDGKAVIFVKRDDISERQRFTSAHELGHIMLGHVGKYALVNRGEPSDDNLPQGQAANVFASRLLALACVLGGYWCAICGRYPKTLWYIRNIGGIQVEQNAGSV